MRNRVRVPQQLYRGDIDMLLSSLCVKWVQIHAYSSLHS